VGTLALILVPAAVLVAAAWLVLAVATRREGAPGRPRLGLPGLSIAAAAAFLLLGLVVAPRLFGFAILFLPLLWVRRAGRRPRGPSTRGGDPPA
jgi:hypothetical protein